QLTSDVRLLNTAPHA
ncbi:hypothetical protein A2U01_0073561, partial [Trifolium medium]|nr:hypothetical protein [Trifolium medium]